MSYRDGRHFGKVIYKMQMTFEQAQRAGIFSAFALRRGRGYMMRSEKRPGIGGSRNGGRKPPRRKKAGFLYVLLTVLVSLILWPIGMVMLWRRSVRMQAGTKLLVSLVTLCASIFLIVFALTVPVKDAGFTAFQDSANDFLDSAAEKLADAGDVAYKKGSEAWSAMTDFADASSGVALERLADGIDWGIEHTTGVRGTVAGLIHRDTAQDAAKTSDVTDTPTEIPEAQPTDAEAPTAAPTPTATPVAVPAGNDADINLSIPSETPDPAAAQALSAGMVYADGRFEAGVTPVPAQAPVDDTATAEPQVQTASVDAAEPSDEATLSDDATASDEAAVSEEAIAEAADVTPLPTATPKPTATPEPTATPVPELTVDVKAAGDITVYAYESSVSYHMRPSCQNMNNAPAMTLADAVAAGKHRCRACGTPDATILDEEYIAWVDADNLVHTSDECLSFNGQWRLIPLASAVEAGYKTCSECEADVYVAQSGIKPKPTATPVPTPTPEPTATPEPTVVHPATALKDAGEIIVYHSSNGKFYHKAQTCKNMNGSDPYPLKTVVGKFRYCNTCNPPSTDLIGLPVLWMDADGLCHTSDECAQFSGAITLIERDEALAQGKTGCTACGADEYLVPNTVLEK